MIGLRRKFLKSLHGKYTKGTLATLVNCENFAMGYDRKKVHLPMWQTVEPYL